MSFDTPASNPFFWLGLMLVASLSFVLFVTRRIKKDDSHLHIKRHYIDEDEDIR